VTNDLFTIQFICLLGFLFEREYMRDEYLDMLLNQKEALEITLNARNKSIEEMNKTIDDIKISLKGLRDNMAVYGSEAYVSLSNIIASIDISAS